MRTETQSATLGPRVENARNLVDRKETINAWCLVAHNGGETHKLATVRWYMARRSDGASPIYCSVWLRAPRYGPAEVGGSYHSGGYGSASGYGYCKRSAAFDSAVESAGITLGRRVDGVGMSAVREALLAIGAVLAPGWALAIIEAC